MFCFQCQEAAKGQGCTIKGMCGKENDTADLQDLLIYNLKGIAVIASKARAAGLNVPEKTGLFIAQGLFTTITNANFNDENIKLNIEYLEKCILSAGSTGPRP